MRDTDRNPPAIDEDRYEGAITEVIAACDSDLHSALRALLIANEVLEAEVAGCAGNSSTCRGRRNATRKRPRGEGDANKLSDVRADL